MERGGRIGLMVFKDTNVEWVVNIDNNIAITVILQHINVSKQHAEYLNLHNVTGQIYSIKNRNALFTIGDSDFPYGEKYGLEGYLPTVVTGGWEGYWELVVAGY